MLEGIDMASFSKLASKPDNLDPEKRKGAVNTVAFHIQGVLDLQKTRRYVPKVLERFDDLLHRALQFENGTVELKQ